MSPIYEYVCRDCGHRFEVKRMTDERAERCACPKCGAEKKHPLQISQTSRPIGPPWH